MATVRSVATTQERSLTYAFVAVVVSLALGIGLLIGLVTGVAFLPSDVPSTSVQP